MKHPPRNKASILIFVLILTASISLFAAALSYRTRAELRLAHTFASDTAAFYLARGGIERALAALPPNSDQPLSAQSLLNAAASEESLFENIDIPLPDTSHLWYSIADEQALFNLNTSDPLCWQKLDPFTKSLCASLLDWIDSDEDSNPDGAESDFYNTLPSPYNAKNAPFLTLREMLYLKNLTPAVYQSASRLVTVLGDGKININTAPQNILAALQGLDDFSASQILLIRDGNDALPRTEDDCIFKSASDLEKIPNLSDSQLDLLKQVCSFDSQYVRISAHASIQNRFRCSLRAVVSINADPPAVLSLERLPQ